MEKNEMKRIKLLLPALVLMLCFFTACAMSDDISAESTNIERTLSEEMTDVTEINTSTELEESEEIISMDEHADITENPVEEENELLAIDESSEEENAELPAEDVITKELEINEESPTDEVYSSVESSSETTTTSSTSEESSQSSSPSVTVPDVAEIGADMVWIPTNGGKKYHCKATCSGMEDPMQVTREQAEANGFTPCGRCHP